MVASATVNQAAIDRYVKSPDGPVMKFLILFANRVRTGAALRANRRSGRLANSITVTIRVESIGPVARVGSDVEYARFVHEGTRPHDIVAAPGKTLRFVGRNGVVFTRRVRHPGYKGNPYLTDSLTEQVRAL